MKLKSLFVILALAGLIGTACGEDYMQGLEEVAAADLKKEAKEDDIELSDESADCAAKEAVESVGEEKLKEADIDKSNFLEKFDDVVDDESAGKAIINCLNRDELVSLLSQGGDAEDAELFECVVDEVGLEDLKKSFIDEDQSVIAEASVSCATK